MKFNKNNSKKSVTFFSFLGFCAIALSLETTGVKPLSRNETFSSFPITEQQYEQQERQEALELPNKSNEETWEKVELDKEWEDISGNESGDEVLIAWSRGV